MGHHPAASEYAPFYAGYVARVPEADILTVLEAQRAELRAVASSIPSDRERYAYAAGKWTIRDMFGHLGDAERVFGYRAFCIGRGESAALPGFDENEYVARAGFGDCPLADLASELVQLRETNLATFRRLDPAGWTRTGTANGTPVSMRAIAYIMAGHVRHHLAVLTERYLTAGF